MSSSTTRELADQAKAIQAASDGLRKDAARCVVVACGCSPSVDVARDALEQIGLPDVRRAALELMDQLAAEAAVTDKADRRGVAR